MAYLSSFPCEKFTTGIAIQTHGVIDNICESLNKMKKTSNFNLIVSLCFSYKKLITFMKKSLWNVNLKVQSIMGKRQENHTAPAAKS